MSESQNAWGAEEMYYGSSVKNGSTGSSGLFIYQPQPAGARARVFITPTAFNCTVGYIPKAIIRASK